MNIKLINTKSHSESVSNTSPFETREDATCSACHAETGLISMDQALALIVNHTQPLATEYITLDRALNRYLADDIFSEIKLPLFSQSAVDGYALNAKHNIEARTCFTLLGEIRAGQQADLTLQAGQAIRIFTGAQLPLGTTTVARQEIVALVNQQCIEITEPLNTDVDMRYAGEEIAIGQLLATKGQKLSVGAIAALSMAGVQNVMVYQYPKVAVVITGDEVAQSLGDFQLGKIFDANAPLIQAWFQQQNHSVQIFHVQDDAVSVKTLLHDLSQEYDVILTTGGVSVGDYDFVRPVALDLGFQQVFWKVKQKPGKPMLFAKLQRQDQSFCFLLGLPGNPAAVYVGMQIYTQTLLNTLQGHADLAHGFRAKLTQAFTADSRERILRMQLDLSAETLTVSSLAKQNSHMLSNLMQANCLVRIPADKALNIGDVVQGFLIS